MADKLLINVAHEETRVALVESGRLANFEIITSRADNNKGNIYKGIVHRVNTSLQAAFVDYGAEKQGFLPLPEIHDRFYPPHLVGKKVSIQDVLRQGQEIMVQVVKDEIGQKGAGLTTFISVAGRSLAIEANSDKAGISRRVSDDERKRLKKVMGSLDVPDGHGAIMRTAAADQTDDAIQENHRYLMIVLNKLNERFAAMKGPGLVHQERGLAVRFIRDYVPSNIDEVLIDDREAWEEVKNFCTVLAPELVSRVKLYDDPRPLFSRYQVEDQIDDIFARRIDLPSGGSIVIDQTEALVAIDVNSGRVKTDDIEDTALKTNLEAAAEVARQLKIRDRGGLIVVDFIDMRDKDNIRKVEDAVREGFRSDKAKVKFSKISEFGLMEISRQRLQGSVMRGSFTPCGTCGGTGQVRSVESSALYLLRRMKETLIRGNYQHLDAQMPVAIANYLLNRKRKELVDLEKQTGTSIEVRAEDAVPAMQSYFELISRSANQARRPKRIMQRIDLVRSEVEKRELEEGEELVIETESSTDEAEASVFAAARKKLESESQALEAELARSKELEKAQQEADESLRREAELRAQRELEEARRETIRTLEEARWKGMSIWGRLKAFFGGGLPPLELPGEGAEPEREDKKRRDRREDRDRDERRRRRDERDGKKDGEKDTRKDGEPKKESESKDTERGERDNKGERRDGRDKAERGDRQDRDRRGRDKDRDRDGRDGRDGRDNRDKDKDKDKKVGEERPSQLMEAGGAAPPPSENSKKKRRRRRRGKGGEEDGELMEGGDETEVSAAEGAPQPSPRQPGQRDGRDNRDGRDGRGPREPRPERGQDRGDRGDRADRGERPDRPDRSDRPERNDRPATAPAVTTAAVMVVPTPEPVPLPKLPKFGAIDLRGGTPKVVPVPPAEISKPSIKAMSEPSKPSELPPLPKAFGNIDLRGGAKNEVVEPKKPQAKEAEKAPKPETTEPPVEKVPEVAVASPATAENAAPAVSLEPKKLEEAATPEAAPTPKPRASRAEPRPPKVEVVEAPPEEEVEAGAELEEEEGADTEELDADGKKKRKGRGRRGGRGRKKTDGAETAEPALTEAKE